MKDRAVERRIARKGFKKAMGALRKMSGQERWSNEWVRFFREYCYWDGIWKAHKEV